MPKAKSDKSCGLNPVCHIKKAVKDMKASMKAGASGRDKRINRAVEGATKGKKSKGASLGNPEGE